MKTGEIESAGLCRILAQDELGIFYPPDSYSKERGFDDHYWYWAYDGERGDQWDRAECFTPLRQNIVLFMAAMNGEL